MVPSDRQGPEEEGLRLAARIAQGAPAPAGPLTARGAGEPGRELSGARVRQLLEQVLLAEKPEAALQWLNEVGLLEAILPEVAATVDFTQEMGRRHKDVWKHTKQVVGQSPARPCIRWAALLHDIGKVPTRAVSSAGKVTFHGHAEVGARMFARISRRFEFPKELRERVRFLILHHLRANQYDGTWTDSAVRRFDREMGHYLEDLLDLSKADITSARPHKRQTALSQIDELFGRILVLREIDSRTPPLPSGLGNEIMARFDLRPGRIIGELRRELEQAIEAGGLEPHQDAEYYLDHLARCSERLAEAAARDAVVPADDRGRGGAE